MMPDYQLRLYNSIAQGQHLIGDITAQALDWQRSIRLQGGYWQGTFRVTGDLVALQEWFYDRLGAHLEEHTGGQITWEGQIYELELAAHGVRRRRSLDRMSNAVAAAYTQWEGNPQTLGFVINEQSISRYGRREELLSLESLNEPSATAQVARTLAENAWPWPRPVSIDLGNRADATLDVTVCGYIFSANWRYTYVSPTSNPYWDGTQTAEITDWLTAIYAGGWLPAFLAFDCAENTLKVQQLWSTPTRVWDWIQELVALGDAAAHPWRIWAGAGRRLHYGEISTTPRYFLRPDGIFDTAGAECARTPWTVQPGVFRDLAYPANRAEPGALLQQQRDFIVSEVVAGPNGLELRTDEFGNSDITAAQAAAAEQQRGWLDAFWREAWSADREKRRVAWDVAQNSLPLWERKPFPF